MSGILCLQTRTRLGYSRSEKKEQSRPVIESITQLDKPAKIVPIPQAHKVTPLERLGDAPDWIDCPFCQRMTKTRVTKQDSDTTMQVSSPP